MNGDNYLKESVIKCVDYAMKQDDDGKRRIFTGLFKYCDRLVNEDILVTCLNDEQKREWLHNELIDNLQDRIDKAIEYIDMIQERRKDLSVEEYHNKWCKLFDYYESQCIMLDLLDILKGEDE